jgi:DNA-binding GntR family transcriptional regulator
MALAIESNLAVLGCRGGPTAIFCAMATPASEGASPLVDHLAQGILQRIADRTYEFGFWLRQETLAKEFEVSRMPIREALRKLEQSGIVEFVANRGFRVHVPTSREIEDAYVVRAELEGLAAERAALRLTDDQLIALQRANELFEQAGTAFAELGRDERTPVQAQAEWAQANDLFHTEIHAAADNRSLAKAISDLHVAFPRSLTSLPLVQDPTLMADNIAEHQLILGALQARDPVTARRAMTTHVILAGRLVEQWFASHAPAAAADDAVPSVSSA